jgi:hypothetical protein
MNNGKNKTLIIVGAILILLLALGATVAFAQATNDSTPESAAAALPPLAHPGDGGLPEGLTSRDELLANALGITVEELQAAQVEARNAAIDQALEDGLITEAQAEWLRERDFGFRDHHGFGFPGFDNKGEDHDVFLADALGISVGKLQAARAEAEAAALAEMVDAGYLTQEQADLMAARQALKGAIDKEALMAEALGINVDELQAAREEGTSMAELIDSLGLTASEVATAHQAAYEAAVQQAVEDGVLTQAQADQILSSDLGGREFGGFFGGHGFHGGPGFHGKGGFRDFGPAEDEVTPTGVSI